MDNKKEFEYHDFLQLIKQSNKQEVFQIELLQEYECMIAHHEKKSIKGICLNEICKQENRRTCSEYHGMESLIKDADGSEKIIQEFKSLLDQQIDTCQCQIYFEQLELCEENEALAYIKFQELFKISEKIQQIQPQLKKLNFQQYLSEQQQTNYGLFQFLQDYQKQISRIHESIIEYNQLKSEVQEQPNKFFKYIEVEKRKLEEIQDIRKKRINIIDLIANTNEYKYGKVTNDQKLSLVKYVEDTINKLSPKKESQSSL
ncbi:hypothetical protein pb186bvf_001859 [Paramecium bursaria]